MCGGGRRVLHIWGRAKTIGIETFTLFSCFLDRVQPFVMRPDREISKKEKFISSKVRISFEGMGRALSPLNNLRTGWRGILQQKRKKTLQKCSYE